MNYLLNSFQFIWSKTVFDAHVPTNFTLTVHDIKCRSHNLLFHLGCGRELMVLGTKLYAYDINVAARAVTSNICGSQIPYRIIFRIRDKLSNRLANPALSSKRGRRYLTMNWFMDCIQRVGLHDVPFEQLRLPLQAPTGQFWKCNVLEDY